jgi:cyanophycinase
VGKVSVLSFESRRQCEDPEELALLEKATGIFLTGGSQLRLGTTIGGTAAAKSIRLLNGRGVHVGGTSAGAAFLSEHMIAFGEEGSSPRAGMVTLAPGLGLTNRIVVDQHFRQRDRLGRLLTALAFNPFGVGVGLDEDTAAFIAPDETLEVVGSGAVTIVDPSRLEYSSLDHAKVGEPVSLLGITLHVIVKGGVFNLHSRIASAAGVPAEGE